MKLSKADAIVGCLLGTAVGDALGLPYEGLSKQRQVRLYRDINQYHFFFGKGMISDDTEHTCIVAQSLIVSGGDVAKFQKQLAWGLRWWLLALPAGVGYATLRAIIKLWLGFPASNSGVFSAGNGTAMRSAIIGVCYGDNLAKLSQLVKISTYITHRDPKAEFGALAIAIAAHLSSQKLFISPQEYYQTLKNSLGIEAFEFLELIKKSCDSVDAQQSLESFAHQMGLGKGITGYIYHTVPIVIHAWLTYPRDYATALAQVIRCGGDTDTTAAILGGIIGASVGKQQIPSNLLANIWECNRSVIWLEKLGNRLAEVIEKLQPQAALSLSPYRIFLRNLFFTLVVILHGLRRLLPPY